MAKTRGGSGRGGKRASRRRGAPIETPRPSQAEIEAEEVMEEVESADVEKEGDDGCNEDCRVEEDDDYVEDGDDGVDHVAVEENAVDAADVLASHFGNIAQGEDGESDNSADEAWRDDIIPEPLAEDEEEVDETRDPENEEEGEGGVLKLGDTFSSASDFKRALLRYSLASRYDIKLYVSTEMKLGAICSDKEKTCPWRVFCSYEKRKNKLQIKVLESTHTCIRSGYSKMLKISTIAQLFDEKLRVDPKFTAVEMADEVKRLYNLIVTVEQCRKAKSKLSKERRKAHEAQFARIWDYEAELHNTNPGTTINIETVPGTTPGSPQRFYRIYICFQAQREAWSKYCRPIIGVDGAFLKWDVKGQLIAAVGRDGDNRIVPIAWAVVEIENYTNWDWFLQLLKRDLGLGDGLTFTIISDKQKGLVDAVKTQLPEAEHRLCARHVLGNWKREGDIELRRLFWRIARSYTMGEYIENLATLMQYNPAAHATLLDTKPETWSRAFFKVGSCCNDILNNLSESFNKTLREARKKPLLDLLEDIRRQCMVRTAKRSEIADRLKTRFTKSVHKQIEDSIKKSKDCVRYMATGDLHEVSVKGCSFRVEMVLSKCGCGKWQLNGVPCEQAASIITGCKLRVEDFVSEYFTANTWRKTYRHGIQPVQGMKLWPRVDRLPVLPPPDRQGKPGRPSNYARRKSAGETSTTKLGRGKRIMTCSKCKGEGHNKSSCKNNPVEPAPKKPRGRPRKTPDVSSQGVSQVDGSQVGGSQCGGSQAEVSQVRGSQV